MQNNYSRRIKNIIVAVFLISLVLITISYNFFLEFDLHQNKPLVIPKEKPYNGIDENKANHGLTRIYFIVYDETREESIALAENIKETLSPMKQVYKLVSINDFEQINIRAVDTVMLAITQWESYPNEINQLLLKVAEGMRLFVGYIPIDDGVFINYSRKLGIYETGEQIVSDSMSFIGDTVIGLSNDTIQGDALITALSVVQVVEEATVFIENNKKNPQFYTYPYGAGRIGVYTADNLYDKLQRGLIAGMLGALENELVYPIIQSGVFFLDDFPSPMGGYNEKVKEEYGLDVETFVRDVWWPDVLALGKQYGIVYTGAVITSYNDSINKPFAEDDGLDINMIYYYGKELIRAGGEICWHGYNHQPLKFDTYIDPTLAKEYHPWPSAELAESAVNIGLSKFKQAFPNYKLQGYVPPSNVVTPQGEKVLKNVFEESLIVCGLYLADEPDVPSYDYKQENGMIYFPRVECDCFLTDSTKYAMSSVMTHVGVFSHFIHPDDALDDERSHMKKWHEIRLEYEKLLKFVSESYPYLRMETVTEAGQHVVEWDNMQVNTNYYSDRIEVWIDNVTEPYYLMVRTNKKLVPSQEYTYQQIEDTAYLIHADKDYINIELKVGD